MFPFATKDQLEVRHRIARDLAADAIEAEIGDVMLAAAIEAAADFDVQILNGFIERDEIESIAQLGGQAARRRDAELAGVRAGAGDDVGDAAGAGGCDAGGFKSTAIDLGQIGAADPTQDEIPCSTICGADCLAGEAASNVGESASLRGGEVAQG